MYRRLVDDAADIVQSVDSAGQGLQWLVYQGSQMPVGAGDVRRVSHDGLKLPRCALQPRPLLKLHIELQPICIGLGHQQCIVAEIQCTHPQVWAGELEGQRNRATAGAQVHHRATHVGSQHLQRPVDQSFGVGTRVQHPGIHAQVQAIELFVASDIGQWLASQATCSQSVQIRLHRVRQQIRVVRQQPRAVVGMVVGTVMSRVVGVVLQHMQ